MRTYTQTELDMALEHANGEIARLGVECVTLMSTVARLEAEPKFLEIEFKKNTELRVMLHKCRKFVRGKHSRLSYGPQTLLDEIDYALTH